MFGHQVIHNGVPNIPNGVNGEIIRRQIRPSSSSQQAVKVPPTSQQVCWIQSPMSNGFVNHAMHSNSENDFLNSANVASDHGIALQSFNGSIQNAGPITRSQSQQFPSDVARCSVNITNGQYAPETIALELRADEKRSIDDAAEYRRIYSSLAGTIAVGVGAAVMSILAFQLLLNLNYYESPTLSGIQLTDGSAPQILRDLSTALCAITMTCSLCALMSSLLHCYLCLRTMGHTVGATDWKERIDRYRRGTVYIRALSNGGFFVGIIIFMLAMIMYKQLLSTAFGSMVSSVVVTVIIGIGALFCALTLAAGVYYVGIWQELRPTIQPPKTSTTEGTLC